LRVRDRAVLERMRAAHAAWPAATQGAFAERIVKYAGLKLLSTRPIYAAFARITRARGRSIDDVIQKTVRGFRRRRPVRQDPPPPCAALLSLLARRLERCDGSRVADPRRVRERARAGAERFAAVPGMRAPLHTHWVFTLLVDRPDELVARLRDEGFDATRVATLSALPAPAGRPELEPREARAMLARIVYVPLYPEMGWNRRLAHRRHRPAARARGVVAAAEFDVEAPARA
jgi:dTDP-4-amino-4,6-dideoxygalactose transaminase